MIPFQFNIDIIDELEKALPSYKLSTFKFVINELENLKKKLKGKNRVAAEIAIKIVNSSKIHIKDNPLKNNETVDEALIRLSKVIATNDIELKKRAKKNGITVVYLRQKRYVSVDGRL
ncbi:MAG: twitching motility protein PilT [Methanobrevibacter sp.]|nr:twitching motility protein PilT [Methanobrevibacter sp.]